MKLVTQYVGHFPITFGVLGLVVGTAAGGLKVAVLGAIVGYFVGEVLRSSARMFDLNTT
jgi:hypothetical protein